MTTPEAGLRSRILQTLRLDYPPSKGQVRIWGQPASGRTGAGHPDLFGVALGHPFALEIKIPKGKLSDAQTNKLHDLRECGTYAWAVRSEAEASRAVYHAKRGKRVPMPEEPIDFDDWFKSVVSEVPEANVIDITPRQSSEMAADAAIEAGAPLLDLEHREEGPPRLSFDEPEAVPLLGTTEMPGLDPPKLPAPDLADVLHGMGVQAEAEIGSDIDYLVSVTKTVGDRVTEVWEVLGVLVTHTTAVSTILKVLVEEIAAHRQALAALLREVGLEQQAEDLEGRPMPDLPEIPENGTARPAGKPRRRRKAVES